MLCGMLRALVPRLRIKPAALEVQGFSNETAREIPDLKLFPNRKSLTEFSNYLEF